MKRQYICSYIARIAIVLPAMFLLLIASCKKESKSSPSNNNNNTTPSPYFFKFSFGGTDYNLNADNPQYMPFYAHEAGGYQVPGTSVFFPSIGIRFSWPADDTVKESDVLGLKGKTLYFNDTTIHPELSFTSATSSDIWYSVDTANTAFNVKVTNVVYLKNDTTLGYAIRTYVITGTCSGVLYLGAAMTVLSSGEFNFIISRRDL